MFVLLAPGDQCQSERNHRPRSSIPRGYGSAWRRISERMRRLTPFCELHLPGCQLVAVDVDHRIPIRAGGRSVWGQRPERLPVMPCPENPHRC